MKPTIDLSHEMLIGRHLNGIKLIRPDSLSSLISINKVSDNIATVGKTLDFPFNVFFHNKNHQMEEVNDFTWTNLGYQSKHDALGSFIGRTCTQKKQVIKLRRNDKLVIQSKKMFIYDEQADYNNDIHLQTISIKFPWYDVDDKIIGVFGCAIPVNTRKIDSIAAGFSLITENFIQSPLSFHQSLSNKTVKNIYFTGREHDVIRCIVQGKTMRETADFLKISTRTVEYYFDNIKGKAGVKTKSQFIEFITR
jgi:DNA-binding CsgD family transcriptional regulator